MRLSWTVAARRLRCLCCVTVIAVSYTAAAAAQDTTTGSTGTSNGGSSSVTPGERLQVTITSPPPDQPIPPTGEISFAANEPGATFSCLVGGTPTNPCTSPVPYGPLPAGSPFTFAVSASLGQDKSAARAAYTVASATPAATLTVKITGAPSGTVTSSSATIAFEANRQNATFRCTLDAVENACASPTGYTGLANGTHAFSVVALDGREASAPVTTSWTVSTTVRPVSKPPRVIITSAPEGDVRSHRARLAFTSTAAAAGFQCSLDRSPFADCTSPQRYRRLAGGSHTFAVRALAAGGAAGPPASARWRVVAARIVTPPSGGGPDWPLVIVVCLGVALAAAIAAQRVMRTRRRAAWQPQARAEPPERPCSERNHYCQKIKLTAKPGPRIISRLDAHARGSDGREIARLLPGRLVNALNGAVADYRRDRHRERLRTALLPATGMLLSELDSWIARKVAHDEVTVDARFLAAEVEYAFTLYVCKGRKPDDQPEWEKEDEWKASLEDEREQNAVRLDLRRPVGAQTEIALAQLVELVTKVDEHITLEVSSESRLRV